MGFESNVIIRQQDATGVKQRAQRERCSQASAREVTVRRRHGRAMRSSDPKRQILVRPFPDVRSEDD